ncbi:hypothetical protein G5V57_18730 [Nordella sp. HKS 07]|uniref:hypothetical protein n=1 Tax=Nordella sp. HKS 07 TaxID=2712222 RepID=UPI0013E14852|nr:hypothetical protein [Nordella sp. HKS 07]QIG49568.1 hypothetical protein G5V57_18730 [Nordella sp. HKS 07]
MPKTFLAPVRGWVQSESLAAAQPNGASLLENFFPTTRGIRPRGGSLRHATIAAGVKSLMVWRSGTSERLFATDGTAIYNITSPASATVQPAADASGLSSGLFSSVMFAGTAGDFLVAVNGANDRRLYDGAAWTTAPAITGVASSSLSHVWVFKNRLFFVQKNTMNAWCLAVDAIGGAATQISLSGVFKKGGSLLFGDSWSVDAGDGLDDICVFISSLGEVVAFSGSDPADPVNWSMEGRYDIGQPLGPNAYLRAGGDLIIATTDGMVPLSAAMNKDPAALTLAAVSRAIEDEWKRQAVARQTSRQWSCAKWVARNMAIIGLPTVGASEKCAYVVNLLTGAWAKYTGWDIAALAEMGNLIFFGTPGGGVMIAEASGTDDGEPYFSTYIGLYEHLNSPAVKTVKMARSTWLHRKPFKPALSFSFDYVPKLPAYPNAAAHPSLDVWDVGLWDVALWDAGIAEQVTTRWVSVSGQGFAVAPVIQIAHSYAGPPEAELVSIDLLYEQGGMAV